LIDARLPLGTQFVVIAGAFVAVEIVVEWLLAATALRARPWLQRLGGRFNRGCGGLFVTMGCALPMTG
jgi:threonine/homoserine/homoserine lactone efflux protein